MDQSFSSYKESDQTPVADGKGSRGRSRKRDNTNEKKKNQDDANEMKFVGCLKVLTKIIKDRLAGGQKE